MDKNAAIVKMARNKARKSMVHHKHCAILTYKGRPIAIGINKLSNSIYSKQNGYWAIHAEIDALSKISENEKKHSYYEILIIRLGKRGNLMLSKPCDKCMKIIKESGIIRTIYYSDNKGNILTEKV